MHEASIADAILQSTSAKLASTPNAVLVTEVRVQIGEFCNVDPESLQFAFDNIKDLYQGTAKCRLTIETVPASAKCLSNKHFYHPEFKNAFCCQICGSGIGKMLDGEEMNIVSIRMTTNNEVGCHA
jgi:hydrogenase nickel incorporation protein HypA/HybF